MNPELWKVKTTSSRRRRSPQPISPKNLRLEKPLSRLTSIPRYWLACIPLSALIFIGWHTAATAQNFEAPTTIEEVKVVLDTVFLLFCAVLVIFMNAGFALLETGFCRQKNAVNILAKNLIVFGVATLAYWAVGYGFMYGEGNAFLGMQGFFFSGDPAAYGNEAYPAAVPEAVSFLFQVAFAATAATIVSGAVAERIHFGAFLIFSTLLVGISYPITGHWVWDGGWLNQRGFADFAGSTVVHSVGGWAALVGAFLLGPRVEKYQGDRSIALPGHNMGFATLGCLILWIGWFGFNPGSQLAADANVPYIALTTNLAAAAGGVVATLTSWIKDEKPDLSMIINGVLAGLVAVTAGCNDVSYLSAIIIGAIAGLIVVFSVPLFDNIKVDDPVGATSVHLVCGIWGTLAVGIFGSANFFTQLLGVVSIGAFTVVFSAIVWTLLKVTIGIRVSREDELIGLDISEHGMEAYSGFVTETNTFARSSGARSGAEMSQF